MVQEDVAFKNILKTSDDISLVHRLVDSFIGRHEEENFCAIAVVSRDGKILAQVAAPDCSEHNAHIALIQAKNASRGTEAFGADRINGKGQIRGHFGGIILPEKSFYVGFYVRHITAEKFIKAIKEISSKMD